MLKNDRYTYRVTWPEEDQEMVRVPPELHRKLVLEAQEAGINLNRLASDKLSRPNG